MMLYSCILPVLEPRMAASTILSITSWAMGRASYLRMLRCEKRELNDIGAKVLVQSNNMDATPAIMMSLLTTDAAWKAAGEPALQTMTHKTRLGAMSARAT